MAEPKVTSEKPAEAAAKVEVLDPCVNVEAGKKAECAEYDQYCQAQKSGFTLKALATKEPYIFSSQKICRLAAEFMVRWYGKADSAYMADYLEGKIKPGAKPAPEGTPAPAEKPEPSATSLAECVELKSKRGLKIKGCSRRPKQCTLYESKRGDYYFKDAKSEPIARLFSTYIKAWKKADIDERKKLNKEFDLNLKREVCRIEAEEFGGLIEDAEAKTKSLK